MKQLSRLHEEFIDAARRPMTFGRLPIKASEIELPVVPMDRWMKVGEPKHLVKTFKFRRAEDRNPFVNALLQYEEEVGHNARIVLEEGQVRVELMTKGTERITELDREYAAFADQVFKDIVSLPDGAHTHV